MSWRPISFAEDQGILLCIDISCLLVDCETFDNYYLPSSLFFLFLVTNLETLTFFLIIQKLCLFSVLDMLKQMVHRERTLHLISFTSVVKEKNTFTFNGQSVINLIVYCGPKPISSCPRRINFRKSRKKKILKATGN